MLVALLIAALFPPQTGTRIDAGITVGDPLSGEDNGLVLQRFERLEPPKLSPKTFNGTRWEFDWVTSGYGRPVGTDQMGLRFRVFSQSRKPENDLAERVAVMDVRMWQLLYHKYKLDHPVADRDLRQVDEYLCWGGVAGGEQMFAQDTEAGVTRRVNAIYIYDIASFTNPLEMAREVAHEYGHAVLPAIGGFKTPEDWANGYLGEKLFLTWLRDCFRAGQIQSSSVMGATLPQLETWVAKNVDPLIVDAASHGPQPKLLSASGPKAMNAYMGLVLYADATLPSVVVANSLRIATSAKDYPSALVEAAAPASYILKIPWSLAKQKLWVPLGKSKIQNAKILARSAGWVQIQPLSPSVTVLSSP